MSFLNSNGFVSRIPVEDIFNQIQDEKRKQQETLIEENYEPPPGTVVYCELGPAEHSGIYVGGGKIVQLNAKGNIVSVGLSTFTDSPATIDDTILVPHDGSTVVSEAWKYGSAVASSYVADNARDRVGKAREYNLILDNCHQFCSGCITKKYDNGDKFLWMLKLTVQHEVNYGDPVLWFAWNWRNKTLIRKKIPDHKTTTGKILDILLTVPRRSPWIIE